MLILRRDLIRQTPRQERTVVPTSLEVELPELLAWADRNRFCCTEVGVCKRRRDRQHSTHH